MANDELEAALDETVETIAESCVIKIEQYDIPVVVLDAAKEEWRSRYRAPFEKAIKEGRTWKGDRVRVLERARQVGYLAAFIAAIRSIAEELVRAGVIGPKQPTTPGQDILLQPAAMPVVDSGIASAAAARIDCDMSSQMLPQWIWCPPPSESSEEMLMAALPRHLDGTPLNVLAKILPSLRR